MKRIKKIFDRFIFKYVFWAAFFALSGDGGFAMAQMSVEEFNARLESMEQENAALRSAIQDYSENEAAETNAAFRTADSLPNAAEPQNAAEPLPDAEVSLPNALVQSVKTSPASAPSAAGTASSASAPSASGTASPSSADGISTEAEPEMELPAASAQTGISPLVKLNLLPDKSEPLDRDHGSIMMNLAMDDLEAELARYKNWQWSKDQFTFTPYVWFWLTATHETNQMTAGDYPLWVRNGERSHSYMDMKASRLGLNVTAPEISSLPGVQVSGVFELDFQNVYVLENEADVELRKAYIQLKCEDYLFLFGQTWELLSPFYPTVLNWGFGCAGGNFGFRRPQIRFDRYFKMHNGRFAIQTCVLSSSSSNFTEADGTVYQGKMGRYPEFQLRLERTYNTGPLWDSALFAVGAKIADKEYLTADESIHRTSWAFTADTKIAFTKRFFLLAEMYVGELLAVNCSSIMQDLNPQTREKVGSTGGWFAFGWDITPKLHYSIGYSVDDPWNSRLCKGMKGKNSFIFTNISRDITKCLNIGVEYEYFQTEYVEEATRDSHIFMFCTRFNI